MQRCKDKDPRETVERIKEILEELDFHPQGEVSDFIGRFYFLRIEDPATGFGTNGKGASAELALASAYGEFMERLQNDFLSRPKLRSARTGEREAAASEDFLYWPDERTVTFEEFLASCPDDIMEDMVSGYVSGELIEPSGAEPAPQEEAIAFWRELAGETVSMVPYYCVGAGKLVELPEDIIRKIGMSNGLAAGNTPEEALVEGMSEICERYAKAVILNDELCPPRIPREFIEEHCPAQAEMLRAVEERSPELNVIVLDANLGRGIPAVSMLFIDRQRGTIRPKFGAHPCISIALERCMTEQYQGYAPGQEGGGVAAQEEIFLAWDAWSRKAVHYAPMAHSAFTSDRYAVPNRMLLNEPDWEFEPWGIDEGFTNKRGARQLAELLRGIGGEVYIRDNGYLGMPAFRIHVPIASGLPTPGGKLAMLTEKHGILMACAIGACDRGDLLLAADLLKMCGNRKCLCAAQELLCRAEGMPEERRDVLLEAYFGAGPAAYARAVWRSDDVAEALREFNRRSNFLRALGSGVKQTEKSAARKARAAQAQKLKARKAASPIDQMRIGAIFEQSRE